jgi:ABC-2 type transport system permease protein
MNVLAQETGAEILKALRAPEFILPTVVLPMSFYSLFAVILTDLGSNATYLLATYGVFAVMGPSIFGFGGGVANERDRGWLQLKRAVPAPPQAYISAKLITTLIFATIALMPIYLIAGFLGGVELPRNVWTLLFCVHLLSVFPFVFIGLILGFSFSSGGAVAISNILFLGLSILGGLWFPVSIFPSLMQKMSNFTPSYHLGELALAVVNAPGDHHSSHNILSISIMTVLLAALAVYRWSRQR